MDSSYAHGLRLLSCCVSWSLEQACWSVGVRRHRDQATWSADQNAVQGPSHVGHGHMGSGNHDRLKETSDVAGQARIYPVVVLEALVHVRWDLGGASLDELKGKFVVPRPVENGQGGCKEPILCISTRAKSCSGRLTHPSSYSWRRRTN